ncbi:MAG: hypothetical protein DME33_12405 [Verrucomicrobia bacterium]|nr:MAG: hypothetical protein DME33_12405 [Verrucomicrobiota bacterium]
MTTRRWNANTGTWDHYTPAHREYRRLPSNLDAQLHAIEPTHDGMMEYFPCMVLLANGEQHDCVYIAEANSYIRFWGVWPDDDPGKRAVRIEDVAQIQPTPSRLPFKFAQKMYAVGESGMGYCIFTLHFADGTHQSYCTGNLIDFPEMPAGKSTRDVLALRPNQGRGEESLGTRQYHWCLFAGHSAKTFMQRLSHALRFS